MFTHKLVMKRCSSIVHCPTLNTWFDYGFVLNRFPFLTEICQLKSIVAIIHMEFVLNVKNYPIDSQIFPPRLKSPKGFKVIMCSQWNILHILFIS